MKVRHVSNFYARDVGEKIELDLEMERTNKKGDIAIDKLTLHLYDFNIADLMDRLRFAVAQRAAKVAALKEIVR